MPDGLEFSYLHHGLLRAGPADAPNHPSSARCSRWPRMRTLFPLVVRLSCHVFRWAVAGAK
jgi:hypothetical protein